MPEPRISTSLYGLDGDTPIDPFVCSDGNAIVTIYTGGGNASIHGAGSTADLLAFARNLVAKLEPLTKATCAEPGCTAAPWMDSVDYCTDHSGIAEVVL